MTLSAQPDLPDSATAPIPVRYTGPAYGFSPGPGGTLGPKPDANVVITSIANILTTPKGSWPPNSSVGSQVPSLLFEQLDDITMQLIRYFTAKDVAEQEPRCNVVNVMTEQPDEHTVIVYLAFQIVGDPSATIYSAPIVFPVVEV